MGILRREGILSFLRAAGSSEVEPEPGQALTRMEALRGLPLSEVVATLRQYGSYVLIRSSRRSTRRNNSTTRPALATIQIHLNQP